MRKILITLCLLFLTQCKDPPPEQTSETKDVATALSGCSCNDMTCWNEKIAGYQVSAAKCALATALATAGLSETEVPKLLECMLTAGMDLHDLYDTANTCKSIKKNPSVTDLVGCMFGATNPVTDTVLACMKTGAPPGFGAAFTLIRCGVTVTQGTSLLVGNTGCLMSDIQNAWASSPKYDPSKPLPNPSTEITGGTCGGEPLTCSTTMMRQYGAYLYKNRANYFSTSNLRNDCASWCGNSGDGATRCLNAIAGGLNFPDVCKEVCRKPQCQEAISACTDECVKQSAQVPAVTGTTTTVSATENTCNEEPLNCANAFMSKYGEWLYQNRSYYFTTSGLAEACVGWCNNSGAASAKCKEALPTIDHSGACLHACEQPQCRTAISSCVSRCCYQDGSCTEAASKLY